MSSTIINLIIQIIAGAIGGNAAAAGMEQANLGTAGNTIAGALGGIGGGQILGPLVPALAAAAGGVDWKVVVGQLVGGSVGGAPLHAPVLRSADNSRPGQAGNDALPRDPASV